VGFHRQLLVRLGMINMVINMNRQEGKNQAQLLKGKMKWAITHHLEKGGTVSSASKRGDGIAIRGKTRGRMV
jgi:hypothetical protein